MKLTAEQVRLKRVGEWTKKIGKRETEYNARTAEYYAAVSKALDKGDTVEIARLHQERKQNNESAIFDQLKRHKEFLGQKFEAAVTKITSSLSQ